MNIDYFNLNEKVFIVAELSANHNQDIEIAMQTVKAAKESGADAIKLQTYTADTLTLHMKNDYFTIKQNTIWDGKTFYDLYQEAYTPWEWQPKIKKYAEQLDLIFFSSPFDKSSVDFLEDLHIPAYKIASFEITDIPLIQYVSSKNKPIIISTGIATLSDIELAVNTCRNNNNNSIVLLKCTSSYPADPKDMNLMTIPNLSQTFHTLSGLSDHTMGDSIAIASVALGARLVEKHFIIDRSIGGPDASFSMEPQEFKQMVEGIRKTEQALGNVDYELTEKKRKNRELSKSLFVSKDVKKGESLTKDNIRVVRPNFGLHPKYYNKTTSGTYVFKNDCEKGTPLSWDIIDSL